jgi:hypothetical protein
MMTNLFIGGTNKVKITVEDIDSAIDQIGVSRKDISTVVCGLQEGPELAGYTWAVLYNKFTDVHVPHLEQYGNMGWVIRNKVVISHSDLMLIYWDGKSAGARNLMNAGVKKNVTVYKIQVADGKIAKPVLWDRIVPETEWGWTSEW